MCKLYWRCWSLTRSGVFSALEYWCEIFQSENVCLIFFPCFKLRTSSTTQEKGNFPPKLQYMYLILKINGMCQWLWRTWCSGVLSCDWFKSLMIYQNHFEEWGLHVGIRLVHTFLPPSPVILWIGLAGKPKWLPLKFGYHDIMHL